MTEHFTPHSEDTALQNHLANAVAKNEARTETVKEELGDFSPWTAGSDDPRWEVLENNPNEVATIGLQVKQAQEMQARSDEVRRVQAIPKNERGGVWDLVSTGDMNMNGDPLQLYNANAVSQFESQRRSDRIEAATQESREGTVKKAAGAALRGMVGVVKR